MKYAVILRFNGRVGGRSVLSDTFEADSVGDALDLANIAEDAVVLMEPLSVDVKPWRPIRPASDA